VDENRLGVAFRVSLIRRSNRVYWSEGKHCRKLDLEADLTFVLSSTPPNSSGGWCIGPNYYKSQCMPT
jgi:hypothetical protein